MRIGIVNDLHLARMALKRVVLSVPGYEVAWQAADGAEALRCAMRDRPDVILMDLVMPVMDGVEATRRIMQSCPCPILIVTATVKGNIDLVMRALSHGGLDAVNTPDASGQHREALLARLARLERSSEVSAEAPVALPYSALQATGKPSLLALGASTGGPEALAKVLGALPGDFAAPVVVIQHMAAEFVPGLVLWLQGRCSLPVELARPGAMPKAGAISVAATDDHLILRTGQRFAVVRDPADYPYRPSVNVLFESLAAHWPGSGVAVILTGMGSDGARGLGVLRQAGWLTVAQDEATSVVYGMPKAAAESHAAARVLPLGQITGAVLARFEGRG